MVVCRACFALTVMTRGLGWDSLFLTRLVSVTVMFVGLVLVGAILVSVRLNWVCSWLVRLW